MKRRKKAIMGLLLAVSIWSCSETGSSSGDRYFNEGDYQKAVVEYTKSLDYKPNDVNTLYNRARALEEQNDFEGAKADFEKALLLDPNNFQLLLGLSNLHHKEKNYTNALLFANRAEDIPGAPAMASFMKARAQHQLGNSEEALRSYENAIKKDKEFGQAYYNRGLLKIGMKNIAGACDDFQLAKVLDYPGAEEAFEKYCK